MNKTIGYRILNIRTIQFATFDSSFDPLETELRIDTSCSYKVNPEKRYFICEIATDFLQKDIPIIRIATQATFELNEEGFSQFTDDKEFIMPDESVRYFTSILYGATRGILVCKLEGTEFRKFILPPVNLTETIDHPLHIDMKF
ncbi:MAG: hypothetical protein K2K26_04520 [Muribaculaceae bacterium]|nr:hypothetical protein [Muribaculaceae bacterium]